MVPVVVGVLAIVGFVLGWVVLVIAGTVCDTNCPSDGAVFAAKALFYGAPVVLVSAIWVGIKNRRKR